MGGAAESLKFCGKSHLELLSFTLGEIIFDTVRGWREAGHPVDNQLRLSGFEVTPTSAED
jgi:hypothetical protein